MIKDVKSTEPIDFIWSTIYYELEAKEQISSPKTFQSFYFFFRNFFTIGVLLLIPAAFSFKVIGFNIEYLMLITTIITSILLSIYAGRWYRAKMVERLLWTYYSLNKKTK